MVDDSHATGFTGPTGRGTHEKFGVMDRVDIITTTLGKALGGALGGCTSGRREIIEWLRQKSRPYLFSNSLPMMICGADPGGAADPARGPRAPADPGPQPAPPAATVCGSWASTWTTGDHPIMPVHFRRHENDAIMAQGMARDLLDEGIYCIGFSFPVVPAGPGPHPSAGFGGPHGRAHGPLPGGLRQGGKKHGAI